MSSEGTYTTAQSDSSSENRAAKNTCMIFVPPPILRASYCGNNEREFDVRKRRKEAEIKR